MKTGRMLLISGFLALFPAALTFAQGTKDDEPLRCVRLASIDRTEVIDNHNIAFFLKGGHIYVNRLRATCRRLAPGRAFSYSVSTGQICTVDTIAVLENFGFGLTRSDTCSLGTFIPMDEDGLAVLKAEAEGKTQSKDDEPIVTIEPVEVDPEE